MSSMSTDRDASRFPDLSLDALEDVAGGGERAYGWSASLSYGLGTVGVTRLDNGNWYFTGGGGLGVPSLRVGASIDRVSVTANDGATIDDALTGWSTGGSGHIGVGGSVFANDSGKVVSIGVGLDAGVARTYTAPAPSTGPGSDAPLAPLGNPSGDYFGVEPSPYAPAEAAPERPDAAPSEPPSQAPSEPPEAAPEPEPSLEPSVDPDLP